MHYDNNNDTNIDNHISDTINRIIPINIIIIINNIIIIDIIIIIIVIIIIIRDIR